MAQPVEVGVSVVLMMVVLCGSAMGAVYKVGDSAGWTTIGNVDYRRWAATKTFHLGDTIVFTYNKQFHNVMQVRHGDYRSCNVSAPIATHSTGNDSFTIDTRGHHYFVCAVPGHCQAGQRIDINVRRLSSTLAPTPSASSSPIPATPAAHSPVSFGASPSSSRLTLVAAGFLLGCGGRYI